MTNPTDIMTQARNGQLPEQRAREAAQKRLQQKIQAPTDVMTRARNKEWEERKKKQAREDENRARRESSRPNINKDFNEKGSPFTTVKPKTKPTVQEDSFSLYQWVETVKRWVGLEEKDSDPNAANREIEKRLQPVANFELDIGGRTGHSLDLYVEELRFKNEESQLKDLQRQSAELRARQAENIEQATISPYDGNPARQVNLQKTTAAMVEMNNGDVSIYDRAADEKARYWLRDRKLWEVEKFASDGRKVVGYAEKAKLGKVISKTHGGKVLQGVDIGAAGVYYDARIERALNDVNGVKWGVIPQSRTEMGEVLVEVAHDKITKAAAKKTVSVILQKTEDVPPKIADIIADKVVEAAYDVYDHTHPTPK